MPLTYCIDVEQIEDMVTDNTVAILAPDLLGNLCDWGKIREIADKYGLIVIQDSADTLGAKLIGRMLGISHISITSFMVLTLLTAQAMVARFVLMITKLLSALSCCEVGVEVKSFPRKSKKSKIDSTCNRWGRLRCKVFI